MQVSTGYKREHSTIYQTFVLQHVIDKHRHRRVQLRLRFAELKSAYDKVQWQLQCTHCGLLKEQTDSCRTR